MSSCLIETVEQLQNQKTNKTQMRKKAMTLTQGSRRWLMVSTNLLIAIYGITHSVAASVDSPTPAGSSAVSATATKIGPGTEKVIPGAAAVVDGHIISMEDVTLECLRQCRSQVVTPMIQNYVLDRECKNRHIIVSESEIDRRIEALRKKLAPATIEESLKTHHMTMAELRDALRQDIAHELLIADQIKPPTMVHCREILVKYGPGSAGSSGTNRTEAGALALIEDIQSQLKQGKDFGTLAAQYSDSKNAGEKGDLGVLYDNMSGTDMELSMLEAAMALHKGEISQPVRNADGYHLILAFSTGNDHPAAEDSLYQKANQASRAAQIRSLGPKTVFDLINQSKIIYVDDADLVAGKPLPDAAAVVDGHEIPMKEVVSKCLADYGSKVADMLVQNYVVDRECERRGIKVSDDEIDRHIADLREQIAPMTLDMGLKMHHTTMDRLRRDFRQSIERAKLVMDQIKPTPMVHARIIYIKSDFPEATLSMSGTKRTDEEAKTLIADIQNKLKGGTNFVELAKQYSETGDQATNGDVGIIYENKRGIEPVLLNAVLAMKPGEITPAPIKAHNGYFLVQAMSTSDNHAGDEDAAYAKALAAYKEQKAQPLISQAIADLIKKSKVVYYIHSQPT
jgi:parvulin-like peptidyl-prolyl isomerase